MYVILITGIDEAIEMFWYSGYILFIPPRQFCFGWATAMFTIVRQTRPVRVNGLIITGYRFKTINSAGG